MSFLIMLLALFSKMIVIPDSNNYVLVFFVPRQAHIFGLIGLDIALCSKNASSMAIQLCAQLLWIHF